MSYGVRLLYSRKPVKSRKNVAAAKGKGDQGIRGHAPGASRAASNNAPAVKSENTEEKICRGPLTNLPLSSFSVRLWPPFFFLHCGFLFRREATARIFGAG